MAWKSVESLVDDLGLKSEPQDVVGVRRELLERRSELHPDKSGGSFQSEEQEQAYRVVQDALSYLKEGGGDSQALVPVEHITSIIRALQDVQVKPSSIQLRELKTRVRDQRRADARSHYAIQRIGSGVFGAVCAGFFMFLPSLERHPILGEFARNPSFGPFVLVGALISGFLFLMTWMRERREQSVAEHAMSESGRQALFAGVVRRARSGGTSTSITRQDVIHEVDEYCSRKSGRRRGPFAHLVEAWMRLADLYLDGGRVLRPADTERIADVLIADLEARGVIQMVDRPSLQTVYELADGIRVDDAPLG